MDKDFLIAETFIDDERVDGIEKVTGKATYTAEHQVANMAYGVFVASTIAKGSIKNVMLTNAKNAAGVIDIITHLNCPTIPGYKLTEKTAQKKEFEWRGLKVFNNNIIFSNGQPIAIVIAKTFEQATYAASLVKVEYNKEAFETNFEANKNNDAKTKKSGEFKRGEADIFKTADEFIEEEYNIPIETHNPMEMHATIAVWEGDNKLTVYDKTQGPKSVQNDLAKNFGLDEKNVRVIAKYVGGAFGSALRSWPHVVAACIAAKVVNQPVKLVLTRQQMFTMVGYRPAAWQNIGIGASKNGKLLGITHHAVSNTSSYEDFTEGIVAASQFLYDSPNLNTSYKLLPLDVNTPIWMRGPGPATGCLALECGLDELAYKLNIDPIALRIINHADVHPDSKLPWTTKYLKECYELGKEKIGWQKRPSKPGTLMENGMHVGYGMAGGVFWAGRGQATVKGILKADGSVVFQSAVSDMGPGTATAMVNIGAEQMGLAKNKVFFELGDTDLPPGPTQGGSGSTSAIGSAIYAVCDVLKQTLKELSISTLPEFLNLKPENITYENGILFATENKTITTTISSLLQKANKPQLEIIKNSERATAEAKKYVMNSFSVHFVKVYVHPITKVITIKQIVSTADAGKIIAYKPARSQMVGGVVGGVGMALTEETIIDNKYGRYINSNLADYHVPVHADIPNIEVLFVNKPDNIISPTGAKGIGEIALVGVAPAIVNAVYNATGIRVRNLPITPDKLF